MAERQPRWLIVEQDRLTQISPHLPGRIQHPTMEQVGARQLRKDVFRARLKNDPNYPSKFESAQDIGVGEIRRIINKIDSLSGS